MSFEGANHYICRVLLINPLVLRLCCFDEHAINEAAKICSNKQINTTAILSLLFSLGKPGDFAMTDLIVRAFLRSLKYKEQKLQ